jgi:predicted ATPase
MGALADYLADRNMLVLLDNFEQVSAAAPALVDLLVACPDLKLFVTSREALRVRGEHEYPVAPLAPDAAAALFAQRAQAIQPAFEVNAETAASIHEICRGLDGLPLAIELAAARVMLFPPAILRQRLDHRLNLLSAGLRDLPARHQTLRSAIAWSYELLPAGEQRLFRWLGIFAGGCTLEAASRVVPMEVETGAEALIAKSLLRQTTGPGGELRLVMLETIREFALEQLVASGEAPAIRQAHVEYFRGLAEYAEPHLTGSQVGAWLDRLADEHDNFRAALRWAVEHGEAETAQRLGGALWRFWLLRGHLAEGRQWLEAGLSLPGEVAAAIQVKALSGAGFLAATQSDFARAETLCQSALALARNLGDEPSLALALFGLANTANWGRNFEQARAQFEASLAIYRKLNDHWGIATSLAYLGHVLYFQAEYGLARPMLDEAMSLFRGLRQTWGIAFTLYGRGLLAINQQELEVAQRDLSESLRYLRQLGDRRGTIRAVTGLAVLALERNQTVEARALMLEAMALAQAVGDRWSAAVVLDLLAASPRGINRAT